MLAKKPVKKDKGTLKGGPVKVPVVYPPREVIFEDTPISITAHRSSETVLYTVDAPHSYRINPFATETEKNGMLRYYKKPFYLTAGIHRLAALSFSRSNPHAAPSPTIRRTFRVQPRDGPLNTLKPRRKSASAEAAAAAAGADAAAAAGKADKSEAPVRKTGQIQVSFTPRVFKTAARESKRAEEEEWLANQAAARKAVQDAKQFAKDLGVDNDPLWLKDKGNEFFKKGDYRGAINAYTAGVTLDSRMPALFSNRAACHLKLDDYYAACNDCSKALSLLTPPVEANRKSRLIAFTRRSAALAGVGDYESAISDVRSALELDPDNEELKANLVELNKKRAHEAVVR
mmetsp:Transcript_823/g.2413  ORF Transcript_823/g.2413 Transcript_823/m.2413 type:complete len:345 (-) Transcript_823:1626-2660(-)